MSKTLVVVESPAKAKTIEKYLGGDYAVRASYGHIRDLPKSDLGVDVDNGFEVSYEVPEDSKKHVAALKKALKANEDLILATDYDREGEAIAFHVASLLGVDPEHAKRVTFTEITRDAILEAFRRPREIDLKLFDAQEARRVLDRLVGYKISPLLWRRVQPGLSAGRVQSVALRMIVEREREIRDFVLNRRGSARAYSAPNSVRTSSAISRSAASAIVSESVRMYVISPTVPSPGRSTPS